MSRQHPCVGAFFTGCNARVVQRCCDAHRVLRVELGKVRVCTSIVNKSPHRLKRYNFESGGEGWNIKYYSLLPLEMPQNLFLVLFYDEQSAAEATMRAQPPGSLFLPTQDFNVASLIKFSEDQSSVLLRYCNQCHDYNPRAACCVNGRTCQRRKPRGEKLEDVPENGQPKKRKPRGEGPPDDKKPRYVMAPYGQQAAENQEGQPLEMNPDLWDGPVDVFEDFQTFGDSTDWGSTPDTDRSGATSPDRMRATSDSSVGSLFYPSPEHLLDIPEYKAMELSGNLIEPTNVPGPFGLFPREFSSGADNDHVYLDAHSEFGEPMLVSVPTWEHTREYIENQMKSNQPVNNITVISPANELSHKMANLKISAESTNDEAPTAAANEGETVPITSSSSSSSSSSFSSSSSSNTDNTTAYLPTARTSSRRSLQECDVEETGDGSILNMDTPPAVAIFVSTAVEAVATAPAAKIMVASPVPQARQIRPAIPVQATPVLAARVDKPPPPLSPPPPARPTQIVPTTDCSVAPLPSPPFNRQKSNSEAFLSPSLDVSIAVFWWVCGGILGAHQLYLRRKGWALLYLCTLGLFGCGWLMDIFRICTLVEEANRRTDSASAYGSVAANQNPLQTFKQAEAYLLWLPPWGILGMHHFYLRRYHLGALYFLTFGLLGTGWIVDGTRLNHLVARANTYDRLAVEHKASGGNPMKCPDPWLEKDPGLALALWLPPWGLLGCHLYYLGLCQRALLYTFTLALAGYGWFKDRPNLERLTRERNKLLELSDSIDPQMQLA